MKILLLFSLITASAPVANRDQNFDFWVKQLRSPLVDVQVNALEKLAEIKNPNAISEMARSLNSENADVRFHAAESLAKIPNQQSLDALGERSRIEKDVYIKAEINRSIRRLKDFFDSNTEDSSKPQDDMDSEEKSKSE